MPDEIRAALNQFTGGVRRRFCDLNLAEWQAATTGTPDALDAKARANEEWMRFWADAGLYSQFRDWDRSGAAGEDALLRRMVHVVHLDLALGQRDPQTIEEMAALGKELDDAYTNYRAEVNGQRLTANAIDGVLRTENDSAVRRAAWEGSKAIGPRIERQIRRLAELRNDAARRMGYADFHRMSLQLGDLDPDWLFALLADLDRKLDEPFRRAKTALDEQLSARFGVAVDDLMPWHYADPFFQQAPMLAEFDFDALFAGRDLVDLATRTYDGLGLDVRDILARSDLYEREGKDQHAFCTHIDREGDIRILCNLQPSQRWMNTLLHELGHAVYDKNIPQTLPWLLRSFPHILTTEAMAMLMGAATLDPEWHARVLGASPDEAKRAGEAGRARTRLGALIFARWVMVVVNFERLLYEDPARDLDAAWWGLVRQYQLLNVPSGRESRPDWAAKYHIALAPAYYQNYLLGSMMADQWDGWLRDHAGGLIGRPAAGDFFRERVFRPGNTLHWNDALAFATGEKLNPDYYVRKLAN